MLELIGVDGLTQWDVGRQVKVEKDVDMVHFSNRPYGYSKNVKVTDGVADVPDMFLTSCAPLRIWAYVGDFEKGYTKIEKIYEVKPKNRPEDYIYTPEEIKTWEKLQDEIGNLADLATEAKENLVAAINEVAADMSEGVALDTTLTQSGQAADAKAVGDALAEKADIPDIPAALPNPNALTFTGAVNATYDGSTAVSVEIPSGGGTDISLGLTSASVGQIIKVKAIDESGKPTEWEAADVASGGGGASYRSWSKVWTLAVAEDIAGFEADNINLDGKSEIMIVFISDSTASRTMANGRIYINGVDAGKTLFNTLALRKDSHSFVIIGRADEGIEYTTMQATAEYQTYPWQGEVKIVHRMVSGVNKAIQWISGSTIKITQASATLGKGVTIEIYVR